jgi:sporulation killing factor
VSVETRTVESLPDTLELTLDADDNGATGDASLVQSVGCIFCWRRHYRPFVRACWRPHPIFVAA